MMPPRSVVHVGAGNGFSAARLWGAAAVEHLWLIDANPDELDQLSAAASKVGGWDAVCVLLGERDSEDGAYYVTSNPSANGRVCADELRTIWPNLRSIQTHRMPERRLDGILDARDASVVPAPNWIYVDCFPAIPILKGAGRYLDDIDVLWARVVLDEKISPPDGSSLRELTAFLGPRGFRQIEVTEGLDPAIGDVIFVRDWRLRFQGQIQELKAQLLQRSRLYDDQAKITAEQAAKAAELALARDAQAELAEERQAQIEALAQDRDAQATLAAEQAAKAAELALARDAQAKLAGERKTQIEALAKERDAQAKLAAEQAAKAAELAQGRDAQAELAAERQAQVEALAQERDAQATLAAEQAAKAADLTQARDAQAKLAGERQAHLEQATQAKAGQEKLANERWAQIQQLQQDAETLNRSVEDLREELRQARQTANLATKLHALRQADLKDLQSRYREAADFQERQHQLMLQLEGKLRIAAQYFHQLQSSTLAPVAIAAVAPPPAKPTRRRAPSRKKSDATGKE